MRVNGEADLCHQQEGEADITDHTNGLYRAAMVVATQEDCFAVGIKAGEAYRVAMYG